MTKTSTSKYGTQRWEHYGYVVEQVGIGYRIWADFVHAEWMQPRVDTQAAARAQIALEIGGAS